MATGHSIRHNLDKHEIASMRVTQAKNLITILAVATSSDCPAPPSDEIVSLALDGICVLLEEAERAVDGMNFENLVEA